MAWRLARELSVSLDHLAGTWEDEAPVPLWRPGAGAPALPLARTSHRGRTPRRDQRERPGRACCQPAPQPFSGQAAATKPVQGGRCQGRESAERSEGSLDRRSPPGRYTLSRLAGLGFGSWAPPGGQTGALAPPAASASRGGLRLEREDGDGAGWAGGTTWNGRPAQPSGSRPRLKREHGDPPRTAHRGFGGRPARRPAAPPRGGTEYVGYQAPAGGDK